jgi:acetyltransferase-like isoleucine patch superfamily enzyme
VTIADSAWAVPACVDRQMPPGPRTSIGANVWIGARATLLAGLSIGEGAIIGAGAVVVHDIPAFAIAAGVPARVIGDARTRRQGAPDVA